MPMVDNTECIAGIRIIYQDESLVVVDKPAGVLSIQDGYHPEYPHLKNILEPVLGSLFIVHRLDRETSGVMVLARSKAAHSALNRRFDDRLVHKTYAAICLGQPEWDSTEVTLPLTVNGDRDHRTLALPGKGRPASTIYTVQSRGKDICLLEALPATGYTHQVRAHLNAVGYPILFDTLYTMPHLREYARNVAMRISAGTNITPRVMLHARIISFNHPLTGLPVTFSAPCHPDMDTVIGLYIK